MRTILILFPLLFLFSCTSKEEQDLTIRTTVHEETNQQTNKITSIRYDTYRGKQKIQEYLQEDFNSDGIMDISRYIFFVKSKPIYSYQTIDSSVVYIFESWSDVNVKTSDDDRDGISEIIIITDQKKRLIEYFEINEEKRYVALEPGDLKIARESFTGL